MDRIAAGEEAEEATPEREKEEGKEMTPAVQEDVGVEPPQPQFIMDMPNISPIDL